MSAPISAAEAGVQAARLLQRAQPGRSVNVRAECDRAARIAAAIWDRWQVGPWQWRCKHVRWFLERGAAGYSPWTRYRYWLTVARLLQVIGRRHHWRRRLSGPWCTPVNGSAGDARAGDAATGHATVAPICANPDKNTRCQENLTERRTVIVK